MKYNTFNECAFDKCGRCSALIEKQCLFCHFRKTEEELIKGRQKALARINTLPEERKDHIVKTYHRQWKRFWER